MNTTTTKTNNNSKKGMTRVFIEGTAFFVTDSNPFDLMAQRGNEVVFMCELDSMIESDSALRREVNTSGLSDPYYLNTIFDTPTDETPWYEAS